MSGIVVIPARGGSKRVPRKNLKLIGGRPMLGWPIGEALALEEVSEVIVSTDDDDIASLAQKLGASVHGRRPRHLCEDDTPTAPVITYEVEGFTHRNQAPDFVVVLYPTSIFITSQEISQMLRYLPVEGDGVQMVMTAIEFPAPIERAWRVRDGMLGEPLDPDSRNRQSQEFEKSYYDAGQAYVSTIGAWSDIAAGRPVPTALYILPPSRAWDINTHDDFLVAEALLKRCIEPENLGPKG